MLFNNLKTTNVSKNNKFYSNIASKNLAIMDFFVLKTGIASFFQPKWTSLSIVLSEVLREDSSRNSILSLLFNVKFNL